MPLALRRLPSGQGPGPTKRAWGVPRRAGAETPHACRLVLIRTAPRSLAWACRLASQAVVSAVGKWDSLVATSGCTLWEPPLGPPPGQWCLGASRRPRRVLCSLSCPGTKMSSGAWLSAVHSLATHGGSKYIDRCPLSSGALAAGDTKNPSPDPGALITTSGSSWRAVCFGDMLGEWKPGRSYSSKWEDVLGLDPLAK